MLVEINISVKKILLALVCSIVIDTAFDTFVTILVMVPVYAVFSGGQGPISPIQPTLVLHLTFRFRLPHNRDKLTFWIAYLVYLLTVPFGSTSLTS